MPPQFAGQGPCQLSDGGGAGLTPGVAAGLSAASVGCVLTARFAVLATRPSTALTEIGFAVAFGILLDTVLVRSVLVTALNLDLGHRLGYSKTGSSGSGRKGPHRNMG
jgi:RND superfamily putative drug exporter